MIGMIGIDYRFTLQQRITRLLSKRHEISPQGKIMRIEDNSELALNDIQQNRFAEALLVRTRFAFGEYHDIALGTARTCLHLHDDHSDDLRREEVKTQRSHVIGLALIGATQHCSNNGISPASNECASIFEEVYSLISNLTYATNFYGENYEKMAAGGLHQECSLRLLVPDYIRLETHLENFDVHRVSKDLEIHIADYLGSKLRNTELDSFMFKLLAEEEPVQYIHEMAWKNPSLPSIGLKTKLELAMKNKKAINRSVLAMAMKGFLYNCIYSLVLIAAAVFIQTKWFSNGDEWIPLIAVIASLILFAFWLWALLLFALEKYRYTRNSSKNPDSRLIERVLSMSNFFDMMRSPGKISLDRIEQKLNDLEQMDAVMPETLYVFITDLRSRGISSI